MVCCSGNCLFLELVEYFGRQAGYFIILKAETARLLSADLFEVGYWKLEVGIL